MWGGRRVDRPTPGVARRLSCVAPVYLIGLRTQRVNGEVNAAPPVGDDVGDPRRRPRVCPGVRDAVRSTSPILRVSPSRRHDLRSGRDHDGFERVDPGRDGDDGAVQAWAGRHEHLPDSRAQSPAGRANAFWRVTRERNQRAVRSGDWKLLIDDGRPFLFDVRKDLGERNNLVGIRTDVVRKLMPLIDKWEADVDAEAKTRS
jgi:hypothetical protein